MGLIIFGLILLSLVLWLTISLKGNWILKFIIILGSLTLAIYTGFSIENFYGWPTVQSMPSESRIYWALVQEPNPEAGSNGALFIWAESIEGQSFSENYSKITFREARMSGVRSYRLEYSEEMKEAVIAVVEEIMKGNVVIGALGESEADIPEEFKMDESGSSDDVTDDFNFYSVPPVGHIKK